MNRMFYIFLFIFCEVANHFVAVRKILVVKGIVLVVEGLNIINLYPVYDPVTGSEQPIYVELCVRYDSKKGAKIRNQYNQVPHLTQDTKWKSNNYTINTTNKSQKVSPYPAGDHKAAMSRPRKHDKHNTKITQMIHQRTALERSVKIFYWRA